MLKESTWPPSILDDVTRILLIIVYCLKFTNSSMAMRHAGSGRRRGADRLSHIRSRAAHLQSKKTLETRAKRILWDFCLLLARPTTFELFNELIRIYFHDNLTHEIIHAYISKNLLSIIIIIQDVPIASCGCKQK